MKTAKLKNLSVSEVTAISNYLCYGIGISKKLKKVAEAYNNDWEKILDKLYKMKEA